MRDTLKEEGHTANDHCSYSDSGSNSEPSSLPSSSFPLLLCPQ